MHLLEALVLRSFGLEPSSQLALVSGLVLGDMVLWETGGREARFGATGSNDLFLLWSTASLSQLIGITHSVRNTKLHLRSAAFVYI